MRPVLTVLLLFVFCLPVAAHDAVFSIMYGDREIGRGTVIERGADGFGYGITVWHVVEKLDQNNIKIKYHDGTVVTGLRVLSFHDDQDIAVLSVWVPEHIKPAKLADEPAKPGDKLTSDFKSEDQEFTAAVATKYFIFGDGVAEGGDSGSPFFNEAGEVVGMMAKGWLYAYTETGNSKVWSLVGPGTTLINEQLKKAKRPQAVPEMLPPNGTEYQFCPPNN